MAAEDEPPPHTHTPPRHMHIQMCEVKSQHSRLRAHNLASHIPIVTSDGDGILDVLEGYQDADEDGIANFVDMDSDGLVDVWD